MADCQKYIELSEKLLRCFQPPVDLGEAENTSGYQVAQLWNDLLKREEIHATQVQDLIEMIAQSPGDQGSAWIELVYQITWWARDNYGVKYDPRFQQ